MLYFFLYTYLFIITSPTSDCIPTAVISVYQCGTKCIQKYGSDPATQRQFYNITTQMCQPKPTCQSGWVYVNANNTCVDDLGNYQNAVSGIVVSSNVVNMSIQKYNCNHGKFSPNTAECMCDSGWKSSRTKVMIEKQVYMNEFCDIGLINGSLFGKYEGELLFDNETFQNRTGYLLDMYGQPIIMNGFVLLNLIIYLAIGLFTLCNCCFGDKQK